MAWRAFLALAAALAISAAGGCLYSPKGRCDTSADCAASEVCDGGVCIPSWKLDGVDPSSFTSVTWSRLSGKANATFAVDSVGVDPNSGDVVVAGAADAAFSFGPSTVGTGAFVVKRAALDGDAHWAVPFPTFEHGRFETAVLPGGDVFFAGTAFEPTAIGTCALHIPPARGALVFGRLATDGSCRWSSAVGDTNLTSDLVPSAVAARGWDDLLVVGAGSADFGCGDTAGQTFAAALSGADGTCLWSRGFGTQTISDIEPSGANAVVAGVCTPAGAWFDQGGAATCTNGLFVATLTADSGATSSLWTTSGSGTVAGIYDLAIAPDGRATVVGDASGAIDFGAAPIDFGPEVASFAATFDATGVSTVVRPIEAPYAANPDAVAFSRCAYDRTGRLWIAGPYVGQPKLGGIRFSACREPAGCLAASFLARLEASGSVSSFLPIRVSAPDAEGQAFVDDFALFATTGTVAHALRFTGTGTVGVTPWTSSAADLGVLRIVP